MHLQIQHHSRGSSISLRSEKGHYYSVTKIPHKNTQRTSVPLSQIKKNHKNSNNRYRSFYNDRKKLYISRSQVLTERSALYRAKDISYSQRKKYQGRKIEKLITKREQVSRQMSSYENQNYQRNETKMKMKKRYESLKERKFYKLVYSSKETEIRKKILSKQISQTKLKQNKWQSPFKICSNHFSKQQGQQLLPNKLSIFEGNTNHTQLKVLNLDRLFRKKQGKLTNIIPIPMPKLKFVTARNNVIRQIKSKQKIHDVIDEYNKLLRIGKLLKTMKIGIKGTNFVQVPTMQEIMGIKLTISPQPQPQIHDHIQQHIFISYCQFYKSNIKKDMNLTHRFFEGLKQVNKNFDLTVFTRFYLIFINKLAPIHEKTNFLTYFFIPNSQKYIQFEVIKFVLELMCKQLPTIQALNFKTDMLSKQEKSKIFLEALSKVLFKSLSYNNPSSNNLSRTDLNSILLANEDAIDLLLKLLIKPES